MGYFANTHWVYGLYDHLLLVSCHGGVQVLSQRGLMGVLLYLTYIFLVVFTTRYLVITRNFSLLQCIGFIVLAMTVRIVVVNLWYLHIGTDNGDKLH